MPAITRRRAHPTVTRTGGGNFDEHPPSAVDRFVALGPVQQPERLLLGLDGQQRAAVTDESKRLCVTAGPGSGKTRVLTRRVAWRAATQGASTEHALVVTFTRAAATEFRSRLADLGVRDARVGTFHAVASALLQQRLAETGQIRPVLIPFRKKMLTEAIERVGVEGLTARAVDDELTWMRSRLIDEYHYAELATASGRPLKVAAEDVVAVIRDYEAAKRKRRVQDFDDLIVRAVHQLERDAQWVESLQWRYRHVYVDEYQDCSYAQLRFLQLLTDSDTSDLCVVGDPDQSIFGFSGVDPKIFSRFQTDFPGGEVVALTVNHRSSPAIVAAAAQVIGRDLRASPLIEHNEPPTIVAYDTADEEAHGLAEYLRKLGAPWSRRAVLARTNAQLDVIEAACADHGIPTARQQDLLKRPEVRHVLAGLGKYDQPVVASRGIFRELTDEAYEQARRCGTVTAEAAPDAGEPLSLASVRMHLDELSDLFAEFTAFAPDASIGAFCDWLATSMRGPAGAPKTDLPAVELRTIHRAKGLEWDHVIVVGADDWLMPADDGEESRLTYVAFSRPIRRLHVTWARTRQVRRRAFDCYPSPHLAALELVRCEPASSTLDVASLLSPARSILAATGDEDRTFPRPTAGHGKLREHRREIVESLRAADQEASDVAPRDVVLRELAQRLGVSVERLLADAASEPTLRAQLDETVSLVLLAKAS